MFPVMLKKGSTCQVKGGALSHDAIIQARYGGKVYTTNRKSWVTILHPTPELWTVTLPHRTQILYSTDISLITIQLELRPGSIVCESGTELGYEVSHVDFVLLFIGTGSGSLSHSIARTIGPSGILYTFEFHAERAVIARYY